MMRNNYRWTQGRKLFNREWTPINANGEANKPQQQFDACFDSFGSGFRAVEMVLLKVEHVFLSKLTSTPHGIRLNLRPPAVKEVCRPFHSRLFASIRGLIFLSSIFLSSMLTFCVS